MNRSLIEIHGLHKSFGGQEVLRGIDLTVERGQSVAILGQSGCGKSVLLKHIMRLLDPDQGQIVLDGENLAELPDRELIMVRRRIGMLFQSAALFDSMTVAENVGLGLKESREYSSSEIDEIVQEKLEMVNLGDVGHKNPAELSGGMRKRVGLARAIAGDPEMLLYDEPTTGLDPITAERIDDLIVELNTKLKVTSVAVTHDLRSAFKIAGRLIMLDGGQVVFDGSPEEMMHSDIPIIIGFLRSSTIKTTERS
jgi:phospholipid/cholesterol/gamma-HCH transport system ATP-binding protein